MFFSDHNSKKSCKQILQTEASFIQKLDSEMVLGSVSLIDEDILGSITKLVSRSFIQEFSKYCSNPFYYFIYSMYKFPGNFKFLIKGKTAIHQFHSNFIDYLNEIEKPSYLDLFSRLDFQREKFKEFMIQIRSDIPEEIKKEIDSTIDYFNDDTWSKEISVNNFVEILIIKLVDMRNFSLMDKLLHLEVNFNYLTLGDFSPLHLACYNKDFEMVDYLLSKRADVNLQNKFGNAAIHILSINWNSRIFYKLLEYKVNLQSKNSEGKSPLFYIVKTGNLAALEIFIQESVDIEETFENNKKLLHIAVEEDKIGIMKFLSSRVKDIDHVDVYGWSALHYASKAGYANMVSFLIHHGANLNLLTNNKESPLSIAKKYGNLRITKLFLASGADTKEFLGMKKFFLTASSSEESKEISSFLNNPVRYILNNNDEANEVVKSLEKIYSQKQFDNIKPLINDTINCIEARKDIDFEKLVDLCGNIPGNE